MKTITALVLISFLKVGQISCRSWLVFYADNSSATGHAFISFLREDARLQQTVLVGCWGFYPKNGLGIFGAVEGEIKNDISRQKDIGFTVEVSDEEFNKSLAKKSEWETKQYSFTNNNCVSFMEDIARQIPRLTLPKSGLEFPINYVNTLKSLNTGNSPCPAYPDVVDSYSSSQPNYHFYTVNYEICDNKKIPCCTPEFVFDIMSSSSEFIAPYAGSQSIVDCGVINLPFFGSIVTKLDRPLSITNYTRNNHRLHAGKVTRYVVKVGDKVYIYTVGVGNNESSWKAYLNQNQTNANFIWNGVNDKLKEAVNKELKVKKEKKDCENTSGATLFLIDVSGSMLTNNKILEAQQATANTIKTIKQEAQQSGKSPEIGILVFSGDCIANPTTVIQPFSTDLDEVQASVNNIPFPDGNTPSPQAIESAQRALEKQLAQNGQTCGTLIVMSDGQSSCGTVIPPNAFYGKKEVRICGQTEGTSTFNITTYAVGFDVPPGSVAERELQYLANISGGKYFNAQDQYQLTRSFQKINRIYNPIASPQNKTIDGNSSGIFNAGYAFITSTQQYDTALILYRKFITAYPADSSGQYNYALMCEANERYKAAVKYYEIYLQNAPNDPNRQFLLDRIATLRKDYEIQLAYNKQVIQSDLTYLKQHFEQLRTTPNAVPLAGEFTGFIQEKQSFYKSLPDILEMEDTWLKQYAKEITQALKEATYFLSKKPGQWDMNGVSIIGNVYEPLDRLAKKLGK